jgi:signal transduction histidine kinase
MMMFNGLCPAALFGQQRTGSEQYSDYLRSIGIDSLLVKAEYLRTREPKKSRSFAQAAYNRALSANNALRQSQALTILGYLAWMQGLYDESLTTSLQALRLTEKAISELENVNVSKGKRDSLERQICLLTRQIGNVYALQQQYETANGYYQKALHVAQKLADTTLIALGMNNIGAIFYYKQQYDSALVWYSNTLGLLPKNSSSEISSLTYLNLGQAHVKIEQYEEALYYATRSLVISSQSNEKRYAVAANITIALAQRKQRRFLDAEQALKRALALADSLGAKELLRDSYEEYTHLEEDKRNYATALKYHRLYKAMNDSMFNEITATRIASLAAMHQEEEQQQEIELLRQTTRNQHFIRNSLIASVGILIIFFVLLWNRYRIKKRSEAVLHQKNLEILQQQSALQDQAEEIAKINIDISQRNEALDAANREKNDLLGIVAHDLKNPLAGIQGLASVLMLEKQWNAQTEEVVEQMIATSNRMFGLIENLLDVNALESGKITLSLQPLDGASIVNAVVEQLRLRAEAKKITVNYVRKDEAILVYADRNALVQVAENLISNAIKYSPHGSTIVVCVQQSRLTDTNSTESFFHIAVKDEGPGISESDQRKLFGKFTRLSAQPTGGEHSTGLGLSIVKKLVERMNGRVWCESTLGRGATFIVELPQI